MSYQDEFDERDHGQNDDDEAFTDEAINHFLAEGKTIDEDLKQLWMVVKDLHTRLHVHKQMHNVLVASHNLLHEAYSETVHSFRAALEVLHDRVAALEAAKSETPHP